MGAKLLLSSVLEENVLASVAKVLFELAIAEKDDFATCEVCLRRLTLFIVVHDLLAALQVAYLQASFGVQVVSRE